MFLKARLKTVSGIIQQANIVLPDSIGQKKCRTNRRLKRKVVSCYIRSHEFFVFKRKAKQLRRKLPIARWLPFNPIGAEVRLELTPIWLAQQRIWGKNWFTFIKPSTRKLLRKKGQTVYAHPSRGYFFAAEGRKKKTGVIELGSGKKLTTWKGLIQSIQERTRVVLLLNFFTQQKRISIFHRSPKNTLTNQIVAFTPAFIFALDMRYCVDKIRAGFKGMLEASNKLTHHTFKSHLKRTNLPFTNQRLAKKNYLHHQGRGKLCPFFWSFFPCRFSVCIRHPSHP